MPGVRSREHIAGYECINLCVCVTDFLSLIPAGNVDFTSNPDDLKDLVDNKKYSTCWRAQCYSLQYWIQEFGSNVSVIQ